MKKGQRWLKSLAAAGLLIAGMGGCRAVRPPVQEVGQQPVLAENVYLANNIHYQRRIDYLEASYANWTDVEPHHMLPVNTRVTVHDWWAGLGILVVEEERLPLILEYDHRRMRMSKREYVEEITRVEKIDLEALSEIDRQGIEEGQARIGMSKEGVRIALGYPARHETPTLQADTWTYWRDRWRRYNVIFDEDGLVKEIQD